VRALASIQRNRSILRAAAQLPVERTVPLRHRAEESLIVVNANKVVYLCNHAAISPLAAFFHARLALPRPIEFLLETTRGCTVRLRRVNFP